MKSSGVLHAGMKFNMTKTAPSALRSIMQGEYGHRPCHTIVSKSTRNPEAMACICCTLAIAQRACVSCRRILCTFLVIPVRGVRLCTASLSLGMTSASSVTLQRRPSMASAAATPVGQASVINHYNDRLCVSLTGGLMLFYFEYCRRVQILAVLVGDY